MLVKHINCHVQRENFVIFLDFRLSQGSAATYCRWGENVMCTLHREFSLQITWRKKIEHRSTFAKIIIKHEGAYLFWTRCIFCECMTLAVTCFARRYKQWTEPCTADTGMTELPLIQVCCLLEDHHPTDECRVEQRFCHWDWVLHSVASSHSANIFTRELHMNHVASWD